VTERWRRIKEVYQEALARDPESRAVYLGEACGDDDALHREVLELLHYDAQAEARSFLEQPAIELPPPLVAAGQRIGLYEINSLLGEGGMGQVYDATDMRLGRRVALKLLRAEIASSPESRSRFLREARSAAALNHPNIATIYDAGETQGQLYLTMEFVDGQALDSLLANQAKVGLPEPDVLSYSMQLASALDHAHSRGILHRDIKPENVIVENTGAVKLVDFGIAKALPAPGAEPMPGITSTGMFVGTLCYAPPEVVSGNPTTRQSDLYSFGIVLFEMLCGQTPFEGLSAMALVGAILKGEQASLRHVNAAVSEDLVRVVERCIAPDPADRFSSAAEVLAALRAFSKTGAVTVPTMRAAEQAPSLSVLEFTNLSQDPSLDWLGTGIVETLDADLRRLGVVRVVSRSRTHQAVRGLGVNTEETGGLIALGNRLGAKWIVTGSFQRSGNRIRVTPNVFKVREGEAVSTDKVDGVWEDLFEVQDRVVAVLMRALELEVRPAHEARVRSVEVHQLDAYEHYSNGRRCLNQMGRDSLAQAKQHFQKAIAFDADYALAYSGLGTAHAMTFIHTSSPEELELARQHLERAIELDGELGEPYPLLCYIYCRLSDLRKALAMGEKGMKLQPDLPQAHYFYSAAQFMAVESGLGSCQMAMDSVSLAIFLDPRAEAQWMIAGSIALCSGQYRAAQRLFEQALHVEAMPNVPRRFVGALCMLGFLHTRQLAWDLARKYHLDSIESMRGIEHVYRDVFTTLSASGLGEIELRAGRLEESLTRFRHAWRVVKEEPRMLGNHRLGIRSQAGMAAAYAGLGEREKAAQHLAEAVSRLALVEPGSWVFDSSVAELRYSIASAQLRLNLKQEALTSLSSALDAGFSDSSWLETDPEWKPLHGLEDYRRLVERVRLIPPVNIDLSRFPSPNISMSGAALGDSA